jgi:hypothetical protein
MADEEVIPSGADVAAHVAGLAETGQLPPELARYIGPDGNFYGTDPTTGEPVVVHPALIRELRPYIAKTDPEYAEAYFRPLPAAPGGVVSGWAPPSQFFDPPAYWSSGIPAAAVSTRAAPGPERIPTPAVKPAPHHEAAAAAATELGAKKRTTYKLLGGREGFPVAPIPTGEPISTAATFVIAAIGSLWGLFKGTATKALAESLNSLRQALTEIADHLLRFAWRISRALGVLLRAFQHVWVRVIWPLLRALPRLVNRVRRLLERDLPKILAYINKIRQQVIELYEKYARPALLVIQRMRQVLLILRLFRLQFADELDARLSQIQGWIMRPLQVALAHIALLEQWLNIIVRADEIIQATIFHNSIFHWQHSLVSSVLHGLGRPFAPADEQQMFPRGAVMAEKEIREQFRLFCWDDTGPMAASARDFVAELEKKRTTGARIP